MRFAVGAALTQQYYACGYWRAEDLWESFATVFDTNPAATAFIEGERRITFGELRQQGESFARALTAHGLQPGDVLAIHGRHCLESVVAIVGCAYAGVVVALLPHMFSTEQIAAILDNSGAKALVALGEESEVRRAALAGQGRQLVAFIVADPLPAAGSSTQQATAGPGAVEQATIDQGTVLWRSFLEHSDSVTTQRQPRSADDIVLLMFSSGTTGEPKGVMHSANTVRFTVEAYARYQDIGPKDTSLVLTAFGFVGSSILGTYLTFLRGCNTVLQRTSSADEAVMLIEKHAVTHFLLMPTHAIDILNSANLDRTHCTSVSRGVVAGVSEAHRRDAQRRLCVRPYPMYGMSESPGHVTGCSGDNLDNLRTSEGRALPGTELLVCDDEDRPLPAGSQGNVLVRGPNRFLGYYRNDSLNQTSLTPDGFFRTGDIGVLDADGYFTFVSRSKDIIRRGGVTISPADVETALRPHPRIADVAVIALPDPRLGERACACIITKDGKDITLLELTSFLEARGFARYLWPEHVATCERFPRTPSLKVQKNELRKQILATLEGTETLDKMKFALERGGHGIVATSLEEVGKFSTGQGFNGEQVCRSVLEYNHHCRQGWESLTPIRSENFGALDKVPFYALVVRPAITHTHGGIRVDAAARVLGSDNTPVPGLLAAGADIDGVYGVGYAGGLAMALAFGLEAAKATGFGG